MKNSLKKNQNAPRPSELVINDALAYTGVPVTYTVASQAWKIKLRMTKELNQHHVQVRSLSYLLRSSRESESTSAHYLVKHDNSYRYNIPNLRHA